MPKWCTVSVPWSNDQVDADFPSLCLTLAFKIAACGVDLTTCHWLRRSSSLAFCAFDCYANVAEARWLRGHSTSSERPVRFVVPLLGLLGCGCLEGGVAIHMGIIQSRYEGSFLSTRPAGSFPNVLSDRRLLCKASLQSRGIQYCSDRGFATARQRCWRAVHNPTGSTTAKSGRNVRLGERRPRPDESTRRVTPVSQRCRAS